MNLWVEVGVRTGDDVGFRTGSDVGVGVRIRTRVGVRIGIGIDVGVGFDSGCESELDSAEGLDHSDHRVTALHGKIGSVTSLVVVLWCAFHIRATVSATTDVRID